MSKMKPKSNRKSEIDKSATYDRCQTPPYGLDPIRGLLKNLKDAHESISNREFTIWEPSCGEGNLVREMETMGIKIIATDLLMGDHFNYFEYLPDIEFDGIVTNPPWSQKAKYTYWEYTHQICVERNIFMGLLMPFETVASQTVQDIADKYQTELILPYGRIDFYMPNLGYGGSGAQMPVAWFTHDMGAGRRLTWKAMMNKTHPVGMKPLFDYSDLFVQPVELQQTFLEANIEDESNGDDNE